MQKQRKQKNAFQYNDEFTKNGSHKRIKLCKKYSVCYGTAYRIILSNITKSTHLFTSFRSSSSVRSTSSLIDTPESTSSLKIDSTQFKINNGNRFTHLTETNKQRQRPRDKSCSCTYSSSFDLYGSFAGRSSADGVTSRFRPARVRVLPIV
jgi:hypothetical protein